MPPMSGHQFVNRNEYLAGTRRGERTPVRCKCGWANDAVSSSYTAAKTAYAEHMMTAEWICRCGERDPSKRAENATSAKCKACLSEHARKWKIKYREQWNRTARESYLRLKYGIGVVDYDTILARQGGVCAICGRTEAESAKRLHVDHDHATGRVRGILCYGCNSGLGSFKDDRERLLAAIRYLDRTA